MLPRGVWCQATYNAGLFVIMEKRFSKRCEFITCKCTNHYCIVRSEQLAVASRRQHRMELGMSLPPMLANIQGYKTLPQDVEPEDTADSGSCMSVANWLVLVHPLTNLERERSRMWVTFFRA